LKEGYYGKL